MSSNFGGVVLKDFFFVPLTLSVGFIFVGSCPGHVPIQFKFIQCSFKGTNESR